MDKVKKQIRDLDIPYPQRRLLEQEIIHDLVHGEHQENVEPLIPAQTVTELEFIHATRAHRLLKRSGSYRSTIETVAAFLPMLAALTFTLKENAMLDFLREGGTAMYGILVIGILLFGREILQVLRLVIIKDHSSGNLRVDTLSVLLGCLALMLVGIGQTVMDLYKSAEGVMRSHLPYDVLIIGAKESLTPIVLSSFLCAMIVLAHYGTRRALHFWQVPIN